MTLTPWGIPVSEVGAYEAKTHLSELLDRVSRGERITITRYGQPVAVLTPPDPRAGGGTKEVLEAIRTFRQGRTMTVAEIRELVTEGRR